MFLANGVNGSAADQTLDHKFRYTGTVDFFVIGVVGDAAEDSIDSESLFIAPDFCADYEGTIGTTTSGTLILQHQRNSASGTSLLQKGSYLHIWKGEGAVSGASGLSGAMGNSGTSGVSGFSAVNASDPNALHTFFLMGA
jgi:hypothetical protein